MSQYLFTPDTRGEQATLAAYMFEAVPAQHPAWNRYFVGLVHLRPIDGVPADLHAPQNTHELMILALEPAVEQPFDHPDKPLRYLTPANVVAQFEVPGPPEEADRIACSVVRMAARGLCRGWLPVEDGGRTLSEMWAASVAATVEHESGGH